MTTIDNNNYELWLLRYAEGELNAEERSAVDTWLQGYPDAAEELALYSEAPRLERDKSVRYVAVPRQHTLPLWPALLRYSAAAAIVLVLMLPALRMGTMDRMETPVIVAENHEEYTVHPVAETVDTKAPVMPRARVASVVELASAQKTEENETPATAEEPMETAPIMTDMLIAIEATPAQEPPVESWSLIVYDNSADWGNLLLAANDAYQESLSEHPLGRLVSRTLPDSRQLEEHVVEPLRQRIDNLKNKRK